MVLKVVVHRQEQHIRQHLVTLNQWQQNTKLTRENYPHLSNNKYLNYVLEDHPKFTEFLSSYFLFMESAELNLTEITEVDNILLETEGTQPISYYYSIKQIKMV